jgi:hypothetical protein
MVAKLYSVQNGQLFKTSLKPGTMKTFYKMRLIGLLLAILVPNLLISQVRPDIYSFGTSLGFIQFWISLLDIRHGFPP